MANPGPLTHDPAAIGPFPREIMLQIMHDYLAFDEVSDMTQRREPLERFEFPTTPTLVNTQIRGLYRQALRGYVWIILLVRTCDRSHKFGEGQQTFNRIIQKLFNNTRFLEVDHLWLQGQTQPNCPVIWIRADCCDRSQAQPIQGRLITCYPSREIMDRSFTEFLNSVVLRFPRVSFNGRNLVRGLNGRVIKLMDTICDLLRNVQSYSINQSLRTLMPAMPMHQTVYRTVYTPGAVVHDRIQTVLESQMRSALDIVRTGVPQYLLLPEFLDTVNRHREFFRMFTWLYGNAANDQLHENLLSKIAGHTAFICSGLAQYLLTRENTREIQRHYTMPNIRPHNQWIFHTKEQFWTQFLEAFDRVATEGQHLFTAQLYPITTNEEVWCTLIQAGAELSLAFARAAIVVGQENNYQDLSSHHLDALPDIRFNSPLSRDPAINGNLIIEDRVTACDRHLDRAERLIDTITDLFNLLAPARQPSVDEWLDIYLEIYHKLKSTVKPMRHNRNERRARENEDRKQRTARMFPQYVIGKKSRRRKMKLPNPRKKQRLKPMRDFCVNEFLRPPFLFQGEPLIDYQPPPFIRPPPGQPRQFMRYPDVGRPFYALD